MLGTFGFSSGGGSSAVLDPTTLPLTVFLRSAYTTSPWTGTASAGSSGSNNASEVTNYPASGASLGGLASPDFDGTNDFLQMSGASSNYISSTAYSFWVLFYLDAISSSGTVGSGTNLREALISSASAIWLSLNNTGPTLEFDHSDGTTAQVNRTGLTTGAWHLAQGKFNGSTVSLRLNSSARATTSGTTLLSTGNFLYFGKNYIGSEFIDGRIREVGITNTALTDQQEDDVKAYINNFYGLSL